MKRYDPASIEPKWQARWSESEQYKVTERTDKEKFVMLTEFPYPSGDGLHLGHTREYTLGDIMARHKRMQGYNVLYPMGYDAFGLPTENYAIKNKIRPQDATEQNVANFQKQFERLGFSIDWSRSFRTSDPDYYRWTQWLFLQFFKHGLAYQDDISINWCPKCKTGLANEEVVNGVHERCGTPVEKRQLRQWMLKITQYADKLIENLQELDYPSRIADQQINWIGKSVGAEVEFAIANLLPTSNIQHPTFTITVFTTRPDTLYGATFMVLAPEHELVSTITTDEQREAVEAYVRAAAAKTDIERQENKEKTGVFTGAYAVNPLTHDKIPVWVADYVLMGYGTGAIMAVPAHDERDYAFATKSNIPVKQVIMPCESDPINPPRDEYEEVVRDTVIVHLRDTATGKYALLDWHESLEGTTTAIMGGIEKGQSPEEAALMEISEEAALKNVRIIKRVPWMTAAKYCASHKKQNRKAISHVLLAEVDGLSDQGSIPENEQKLHTLVWVDETEVSSRLTPVHQKQVWDLLQHDNACLAGEGELINSGPFDGLSSAEARELIVQHLEREGKGKERVNFRLRDWIFSRQHYWGEPIPIVHCPEHGAVPVPDDQLPVTLPDVEHYEPTDTGESPLAAITDWVNTTCPTCGGAAKRETDTMPNWAGSSWYYLRYFDAHNDQEFAARDKLDYWGMVNLYLGGMEHTTLHLLYSRFWHEFFYDIGLVPTPEPYAARRGQGIILAEDGRKMSKSLGNVVNPMEVVDAGYGADALRLAIAFIAPYDQTTPWDSKGVAGTYRFLNRVWTLVQEHLASETEGSVPVRLTHQLIKKVSTDLDTMSFNTAIAAMMEYTNDLYKLKTAGMQGESWRIALKLLLKVLAPYAPHITEELWSAMGFDGSIHTMEWPHYDEALLVDETVKIVLQVNGKVRATMTAAKDTSDQDLERLALAHERVQEYLTGNAPKRVVVIPNRLVNVVV